MQCNACINKRQLIPTRKFEIYGHYIRSNKWFNIFSSGSALVQIMACRLFCAEPLYKPMLVIVNGNLGDKLQWNFNQYVSLSSFLIDSCDILTHIILSRFTSTRTIVWLSKWWYILWYRLFATRTLQRKYICIRYMIGGYWSWYHWIAVYECLSSKYLYPVSMDPGW